MQKGKCIDISPTWIPFGFGSNEEKKRVVVVLSPGLLAMVDKAFKACPDRNSLSNLALNLKVTKVFAQ